MKSIGKIIYSPKSHLGSPQNWAVLMCDDEIGKYYRHLYEKEHQALNGEYSIKLGRSVWGTHCSFLRNDKLSNQKLWGLDAGKIIEFDYYPPVKNNKEYYWVEVSCPYLLDLRERLGLRRQPKYPLHLTIGRIT